MFNTFSHEKLYNTNSSPLELKVRSIFYCLFSIYSMLERFCLNSHLIPTIVPDNLLRHGLRVLVQLTLKLKKILIREHISGTAIYVSLKINITTYIHEICLLLWSS